MKNDILPKRISSRLGKWQRLSLQTVQWKIHAGKKILPFPTKCIAGSYAPPPPLSTGKPFPEASERSTDEVSELKLDELN